MAHARCVLDTSGYKHTLTAFPQQQWLHERASMLRYAYIACLVCSLLLRFLWQTLAKHYFERVFQSYFKLHKHI
jgi:hypothetical protein